MTAKKKTVVLSTKKIRELLDEGRKVGDELLARQRRGLRRLEPATRGDLASLRADIEELTFRVRRLEDATGRIR